MITAAEFCNKANGKPWVNRAEGPDSYDCWGLVLASFREIEGIELPNITVYKDKHCATNEAVTKSDLAKFTEVGPIDGAIMTISNNAGGLIHVGRVLCGRVLHATDTLGVRWESISSINSRNKNIRYFNYE